MPWHHKEQRLFYSAGIIKPSNTKLHKSIAYGLARNTEAEGERWVEHWWLAGWGMCCQCSHNPSARSQRSQENKRYAQFLWPALPTSSLVSLSPTSGQQVLTSLSPGGEPFWTDESVIADWSSCNYRSSKSLEFAHAVVKHGNSLPGCPLPWHWHGTECVDLRACPISSTGVVSVKLHLSLPNNCWELKVCLIPNLCPEMPKSWH